VLRRGPVGVSSARSSFLAGGTGIPANFGHKTHGIVFSYIRMLMAVKLNLSKIFEDDANY
jgi:hypothetical protein